MKIGFKLPALALCSATALAMALSMPASADDTPAPGASQAPAVQATAPAASEPAPGSPEEVVCKKEEPMTGTMLGARKICKTRKEWDDLQRDSQTVLRESQEHSLRTNPVPDAGGN